MPDQFNQNLLKWGPAMCVFNKLSRWVQWMLKFEECFFRVLRPEMTRTISQKCYPRQISAHISLLSLSHVFCSFSASLYNSASLLFIGFVAWCFFIYSCLFLVSPKSLRQLTEVHIPIQSCLFAHCSNDFTYSILFHLIISNNPVRQLLLFLLFHDYLSVLQTWNLKHKG